MQVSSVSDHVTHAVIGGKQTIDFGISDSAEFFNILSSTLYSDQILAVVREVLCNAWDAHIEAGCSNRPIEITLDNEKLSIRDYGLGIHHDDIGPIYGVYGNSTKKHDGKQTGGFGLGCKAPFAYTEHFEVVSSHAGVRTIYNMSKSSAQVMGKPGIIPIASFPTTETGLQVTIQLKSDSDWDRFDELIRRIVFNGEMNALFNGKQLDTFKFSELKNNYLITKESDLLESNHRIMVRYGNVIYPVDETKELITEYKAIVRHLDQIGGNYYRGDTYRIVFSAPPHSISVTPSRETLSMQEHTIKTLKKLFTGFLNDLQENLDSLCVVIAKNQVDKAVAAGEIGKLLQRENTLPFVEDIKAPNYIETLDEFALQYMAKHYPNDTSFRKNDIVDRLLKIIHSGQLNRGLVQTYVRCITHPTKAEVDNWIHRRVIGPLVQKLKDHETLDHMRLFAVDTTDLNLVWNQKNKVNLAKDYKPRSLLGCLPFLRNIMVISRTRKDVSLRLRRHDDMKIMGEADGYLLYTPHPNEKNISKAREYFTEQGFHVIDLTVRQSWESPIDVEVIPREYKPRKKGIPLLSSIKEGNSINTALYKKDDAVRTDSPEAVLFVPLRQDISNQRLYDYSSIASRIIVNLYGDKVGIVVSSSQSEVWERKGAKIFREWMFEKLSDSIRNNPRILEYYAYHPTRVIEYMNKKNRFCAPEEIVNFIYENENLRKEFNLVCNLTSEDIMLVSLWKELSSDYSHNRHLTIQNTQAFLQSIPLHPNNIKVADLIIGNDLLALIDVSGVRRLLKNNVSTDPIAIKAMDIFLTALRS